MEILKAASTDESGETDLAAIGFLRLLKFLRMVLLQDAVELIRIAPTNIVFQHDIFCGDEFNSFSLECSNTLRTIEDPTDLALKLALPQMSEVRILYIFPLFGTKKLRLENRVGPNRNPKRNQRPQTSRRCEIWSTSEMYRWNSACSG